MSLRSSSQSHPLRVTLYLVKENSKKNVRFQTSLSLLSILKYYERRRGRGSGAGGGVRGFFENQEIFEKCAIYHIT